MKYVTRTEVVDAVQFKRGGPLPAGAYYCDHDVDDEPVRGCCIGALIVTDDGLEVLSDGDWIVVWPSGEMRKLTKASFELRFEVLK